MSISVNCKLLLYADDSILVVSDKDPDVISHRLSENLESCYNWLVDNKLSLHFGKTECMIFGSKRKLKHVKDFQLICRNHVIKGQESIKYLGLTLDQDVSGTSIVQSLIKKSSSKLKFLYRQANFLNQDARKTLCSALLLSNLEYASAAWYPGLSKTYKSKLQIIQNKSVRYIKNYGPRKHVGYHEINNLRWLNIHYRQVQLSLNTVYKIFNGVAPEYLSDNFIPLSNIHNYNTRRNAFSFFIPNNTSQINKTFFYNSIKNWNLLPVNVKSSQSVNVFKTKVKQHLNNMFKNDDQSNYVYY